MRVLMLVVFTALVILIINRYADKIKAHPEKSVQFFRRKEDLAGSVSANDDLTLSGRQKGALVIFVLHVRHHDRRVRSWTSINPIGRSSKSSWHGSALAGAARGAGRHHAVRLVVLPEIAMLVMVMTLLTGVIMRHKADKIIDTLVKGAAGLVSTAFVVPLARGTRW